MVLRQTTQFLSQRVRVITTLVRNNRKNALKYYILNKITPKNNEIELRILVKIRIFVA